MTIYHIISNKVWGGGEQYAFDLCRRLQADGHRVVVVCRPVDTITTRMKQAGIEVHTLPLKGVADVRSAKKLAAIVGKEPCVVHVHNFKDAFTACYARLFNHNGAMSVVVTRHLVRHAKTSLPYRWLYRHVDRVVFVSHAAMDSFLATNPTIDKAKLCVVLNSISLPESTQAEDLHSMFAIDADMVVAMYHGRISPEKGLITLINALTLKHNMPLHLVIIGSGDETYTAFLKEKIKTKRLEGRVHLIGFRPNVFSYIRGADFGVVPSIVPESSSLACMEYMSQGKCVITTTGGGQQEYITSGINGMLVPPADSHALADALSMMTNDAAMRRNMGKAASDYFQSHLNYDIFYKKIVEVYTNLRSSTY